MHVQVGCWSQERRAAASHGSRTTLLDAHDAPMHQSACADAWSGAESGARSTSRELYGSYRVLMADWERFQRSESAIVCVYRRQQATGGRLQSWARGWGTCS